MWQPMFVVWSWGASISGSRFLAEHHASIYGRGGGDSSIRNHCEANRSVRFIRQRILHFWLHQPRLNYIAHASSHSISCYRCPYFLSSAARRPWIHRHKAFSFHVSSVPWRRLENLESQSQFLWMSILERWSSFSDPTFSNELAEDEEVVPTWSSGVPPLTYEDLEEQKSKLDEITSTSAHSTRPSKQLKHS